MPILSYRCLNSTCRSEFTLWTDEAQSCPKCRSERIRWIPCSVNIASKSPGVDKDLRAIADGMGLSNLRSAREGESAMPRAPEPTGETFEYEPVKGMGAITVHRNPLTGAPMPSAGFTGYQQKFTPAIKPTYKTPGTPGLGAHNTTIEGRATGKGDT
jgi:DNA-directed RNA polymerase subunit RPC12/RpoP